MKNQICEYTYKLAFILINASDKVTFFLQISTDTDLLFIIKCDVDMFQTILKTSLLKLLALFFQI